MTEAVWKFRIARLELEHGDIVVVKSNRKPNGSFVELMPPGVKVLFIPEDVELSVMTKAEIEARAISK